MRPTIPHVRNGHILLTVTGAVMNEVAAVTRRLMEGLLTGGTIVPAVAKAFESKAGMTSVQTNFRTCGSRGVRENYT